MRPIARAGAVGGMLMKTLSAFLFVLLASGCGANAMPGSTATPSNEGSSPMAGNTDSSGLEYRNALAELIERSDRIVVSEHSFEFDAYDAQAGKSRIPETVVYGRRELSGDQRAFFLSTVEGLDPATQDAFTACIFEPHHTIEFYAQDERIGTMAICFKCSQVEWDGAAMAPPWALYSGLAKLVEAAGFSPERDWGALAEQHLKR